MAKSNAERQREYRKRQRKGGLRRYEFWLTEQQHRAIQRYLKWLTLLRRNST